MARLRALQERDKDHKAEQVSTHGHPALHPLMKTTHATHTQPNYNKDTIAIMMISGSCPSRCVKSENTL